MPFAAAAEVIAAASGFAGKVLIDATNPLGMVEGGLGLTMGFTTSGVEQLAGPCARGAGIQSVQSDRLREHGGHPALCQLDRRCSLRVRTQSGKRTVLWLVSDAGFEAVDVGGLRTARLLESLAMLWIELARKRGLGPDFAFSLQRKGK